MTGFAEADLSADGFLGGRLLIWQPRSGYRAGVDPVLLAAAVPARSGEAVLELGIGAGVASLCLAARVPGLQLVGIEKQPGYAALARRNAAANGMALQVVEADLQALPAAIREINFDQIIANPPYFPKGHSVSPDPGRAMARTEDLPVAGWVATGLRRLRHGGRLTLIQAAARLPEVLAALPETGVSIQPLAPRTGRAATLVIVSTVKGSRAAFCLKAPLVLHEGATHSRDGDDYADWASAVLREGAALP